MIHKLSFWGHPTVPDTKVDFNSGFNLIHAPNGKGKSTVLELIGYSLFGTEALRASAGAEYPNLGTELAFTVNGKHYIVVRSKKRTEITHAGVTLAVGTTAVNALILHLFGYNSKVYNVANYVRQDHVKALTHVLRADDRRKVLENTIGLGVMDNVIKELSDTLRGFSAEAKALETVLASPLERPVKPTMYIGKERAEQLEASRKIYERYAYLKGQLASLDLTRPVKPQDKVEPHWGAAFEKGLEELQEKQQNFNNYQRELANLKAMVSAKPKLGAYQELIERHTFAELEDLLAQAAKHKRVLSKHHRLVDEELRLPKPKLTPEAILGAAKDLELHAEWVEYQKLLEAEQVDCPNCGEHFSVHHKELAEYPFTPDSPKPKVLFDSNTLWHESRLWSEVMPKREELKKQILELLPLAGKATKFFQEFPCLKPEQLDSDYQIIKDMWLSHREWLKGNYETKLEDLQTNPPQDYSDSIKRQKARIAEAHDVQKQWATYDALAKAYAENEAKAKAIRTELDETEYAAKGYPEWLELDKACSNYEFELQVYRNRLLEREAWQTKLAEMNAAIEDYTLAIKGLKAAKNEIKNHLLPSLNNAASQLAATMSAGAINSVLMLDDFSIKAMKADRYRPVETFSGSEASIINLALRIALGQVLTHSVFSVLIGDEIDASMDSARTAAVWSALARLVEANKIKQVILVSHESEPIQVQGLNYVHFS